MDKIKWAIIEKLIKALLPLLTKDILMGAVDAGLDFIRDRVKDSGNKIDDAVVLPLLKIIRDTFGIEDGDD